MKPTSQLTRSLENVETELLIQTFADRVLVLITQVGKVGRLIQASIPPTAPLLPSSYFDPEAEDVDHNVSLSPSSTTPILSLNLPEPPPSIQLTPLLGSAPTEHVQTLHTLYVSQVATLVWLALERSGGERRPVVVGIALKKAGTGSEVSNKQGLEDGALKKQGTWDEATERKTFIGVMQMVKEVLGG